MAFSKSMVAAIFALTAFLASNPAFAQNTTTPTAKICGSDVSIDAGPIATADADLKAATALSTSKAYPSAATKGAAAVANYKVAIQCYVLQKPPMCAEANTAAESAQKAAKIVNDAATAVTTIGVTNANAQAKADNSTATATAKACNALTSSSPGLGDYTNVLKMVFLAAIMAVWSVM